MRLNKSQKRIAITGLLIISAALIIWAAFGGEIFTKTQVLVEKNDELLGTNYKVWEDIFILGLDYTLVFSVFVFFITSITLIFKRDKKNK